MIKTEQKLTVLIPKPIFINGNRKLTNKIDKKCNRENLVGRRLLGRLRLRWIDCVKKDTETVKPNSHWPDLAENRDRW